MKKTLIKIAVIIAMVAWVVTTTVAITSGKTGESVKPAPFPPVHSDSFFDSRYFYGEEKAQDYGEKIVFAGAVVPHHLLAGRIIEEVFAQLSVQNPETVILVGPNHYNRGNRIITSSLGWETPFGTVEVNKEIIDKLSKNSFAAIDDEICGMEHSVGAIMPYIKYYLPKAKVVPIILHHGVSLEESNKLGKAIAQLAGRNTVVIASVDFSHYLTRREAAEKDRETLEVLTGRNFGRLFQMGNDHLDSPASLGVLFSTMESLGGEEFQVLQNTNSGELLGNDRMETTSYFTMLFPKKM